MKRACIADTLDVEKGRHSITSQKELPIGWVWRTLYDIAEINPKIDKTIIPDNTFVSFVPMQAVGAGNNQIDVSQLKPAKEVKKGYTSFQEGDVLFAKITPCMENGKIAVVLKLNNGHGFGSTEFHVLRPKPDIDAQYLYYFISNKDFRREAAHRMTGAVGQKRVPVSFIAESKIPLAPFGEQKRIVAEIEKHFSRLDEAMASLKRAKANLKRYKAAVLKAAVEGKLTEEWRKQHPDVEPASELLKRVLAERKKKWEAEHPGKKYKEPAAPDTSNLPELPEGWVWASADQCTNLITDGEHITPQRASSSGVFLLSARNILNGELSFEKVDYISEKVYEKLSQRFVAEAGDVLLSCSGSVGRSCIVPQNIKFFIVRSVAILKPLLKMGNYLSFLIRSPFLQRQIENKKTQTAQANIFQGKIKSLVFPIPPLIEQANIIGEIERGFSVAGEIELIIETNLKRSERLRHSILSKAFRGKLVYKERR